MVSGDAILGQRGIEEKEEINLIQIASASSKLFTLSSPGHRLRACPPEPLPGYAPRPDWPCPGSFSSPGPQCNSGTSRFLLSSTLHLCYCRVLASSSRGVSAFAWPGSNVIRVAFCCTMRFIASNCFCIVPYILVNAFSRSEILSRFCI